jgi:hypothetical protein
MDADLSLGLIYHLKRQSHTRFCRTVPLNQTPLLFVEQPEKFLTGQRFVFEA